MNSRHDALSETLASWKVSPPPDPGFRAAVWGRIRKRSDETWPSYLRAHASTWVAVAVAMLAAAAYTGHATARAQARSDREALVDTYLVDLDPRVQASLRP